MRRGFTILELLVAALLLGMLVTILTMIFNQSSIAWRTGVAGVADLDDVRDNMAEMREEADNAFAWNGEVRRITGLWDKSGNLFDRACDAPSSRAYSDGSGRLRANILDARAKNELAGTGVRNLYSQANLITVGSAGSSGSVKSYTVNVMSKGPDREFDTWDDIWSWPDDFD